MTDFFIHAIGEVTEELTYERLKSILNDKAIYSRKRISEIKNETIGKNDYGLKIPKEKEWMYYDEDIHYDMISLHDTNNHFIKKAIEKDVEFSCFRPTKIAFAISRDVPILDEKETKGTDIGEVQVKGEIPAFYINGIIIPSEKYISEEVKQKLIEVINKICDDNDFSLPILNYKGDILYEALKR